MGAPKSLRLPGALEEELEREFARRGVKEWSAGIVDLLREAVRMRRVPGIVFVDSRTGRRPMVAGTGLDVWEIIAAWHAVARDEARLREAFDWLGSAQLRAALNYYALYPEEIDARLAVEERWTPERVRSELPFTTFGPELAMGAGPEPPKADGEQ
jgi:uncharacterized protein (DUF433 family)